MNTIEFNNKKYKETTSVEYGKAGKNRICFWDENRHQHFYILLEDRVLENQYSNLTVNITSEGYVTLIEDGKDIILLGKYPNARFELIEQMLAEVKNGKN